jgi:hypothetical protein
MDITFKMKNISTHREKEREQNIHTNEKFSSRLFDILGICMRKVGLVFFVFRTLGKIFSKPTSLFPTPTVSRGGWNDVYIIYVQEMENLCK